MKIFLSSLENAPPGKEDNGMHIVDRLIDQKIKMYWNLMSYYYIRGRSQRLALTIRDNSELVLIDSGAHSFQFGLGKEVNWEDYTREYAAFIKEFDRPNVLGYFEMDIENLIGYDRVLQLRRILESVTDKVIPVWHPLRGINEYEKMCQEYAGRIVAIGGFRGTDIRDDQFIMFLKVARKYGCKVHCLGMTRMEVLDKVPFDFTDSSTWSAQGRFGSIGYGRFKQGKVTRDFSRNHRGQLFVENYKCGIEMQKYYYRLWKRECKD